MLQIPNWVKKISYKQHDKHDSHMLTILQRRLENECEKAMTTMNVIFCTSNLIT